MKHCSIIWIDPNNSSNSKQHSNNFLISNQKTKDSSNSVQYFYKSDSNVYALFKSKLFHWENFNLNKPPYQLEFLKRVPKDISNFFKVKVKKINCNNFVSHAITENGLVYSWGNDNQNTGILGLGQDNLMQPHPLINKNFNGNGSEIIDIFVSEFHCCALNSKRELYTWGQGKYGELGQDLTFRSYIPKLINFGSNIFITKIQCGRSFTSFLNYNGDILYFGKIDNIDNFTLETDNFFKKQNTFSSDLKIVNNIAVNDYATGPHILALIENSGSLYLYNESEGLYKIPYLKPIKAVKFIESKFYAITLNRESVYEFSYKSGGGEFKLANYMISNVYHLDREITSKVAMMQTPYFSNLLFFSIECADPKTIKRNLILTDNNRLLLSDEENRPRLVTESEFSSSKNDAKRDAGNTACKGMSNLVTGGFKHKRGSSEISAQLQPKNTAQINLVDEKTDIFPPNSSKAGSRVNTDRSFNINYRSKSSIEDRGQMISNRIDKYLERTGQLSRGEFTSYKEDTQRFNSSEQSENMIILSPRSNITKNVIDYEHSFAAENQSSKFKSKISNKVNVETKGDEDFPVINIKSEEKAPSFKNTCTEEDLDETLIIKTNITKEKNKMLQLEPQVHNVQPASTRIKIKEKQEKLEKIEKERQEKERERIDKEKAEKEVKSEKLEKQQQQTKRTKSNANANTSEKNQVDDYKKFLKNEEKKAAIELQKSKSEDRQLKVSNGKGGSSERLKVIENQSPRENGNIKDDKIIVIRQKKPTYVSNVLAKRAEINSSDLLSPERDNGGKINNSIIGGAKPKEKLVTEKQKSTKKFDDEKFKVVNTADNKVNVVNLKKAENNSKKQIKQVVINKKVINEPSARNIKIENVSVNLSMAQDKENLSKHEIFCKNNLDQENRPSKEIKIPPVVIATSIISPQQVSTCEKSTKNINDFNSDRSKPSVEFTKLQNQVIIQNENKKVETIPSNYDNIGLSDDIKQTNNKLVSNNTKPRSNSDINASHEFKETNKKHPVESSAQKRQHNHFNISSDMDAYDIMSYNSSNFLDYSNYNNVVSESFLKPATNLGNNDSEIKYKRERRDSKLAKEAIEERVEISRPKDPPSSKIVLKEELLKVYKEDDENVKLVDANSALYLKYMEKIKDEEKKSKSEPPIMSRNSNKGNNNSKIILLEVNSKDSQESKKIEKTSSKKSISVENVNKVKKHSNASTNSNPYVNPNPKSNINDPKLIKVNYKSPSITSNAVNKLESESKVSTKNPHTNVRQAQPQHLDQSDLAPRSSSSPNNLLKNANSKKGLESIGSSPLVNHIQEKQVNHEMSKLKSAGDATSAAVNNGKNNFKIDHKKRQSQGNPKAINISYRSVITKPVESSKSSDKNLNKPRSINNYIEQQKNKQQQPQLLQQSQHKQVNRLNSGKDNLSIATPYFIKSDSSKSNVGKIIQRPSAEKIILSPGKESKEKEIILENIELEESIHGAKEKDKMCIKELEISPQKINNPTLAVKGIPMYKGALIEPDMDDYSKQTESKHKVKNQGSNIMVIEKENLNIVGNKQYPKVAHNQITYNEQIHFINNKIDQEYKEMNKERITTDESVYPLNGNLNKNNNQENLKTTLLKSLKSLKINNLEQKVDNLFSHVSQYQPNLLNNKNAPKGSLFDESKERSMLEPLELEKSKNYSLNQSAIKSSLYQSNIHNQSSHKNINDNHKVSLNHDYDFQIVLESVGDESEEEIVKNAKKLVEIEPPKANKQRAFSNQQQLKKKEGKDSKNTNQPKVAAPTSTKQERVNININDYVNAAINPNHPIDNRKPLKNDQIIEGVKPKGSKIDYIKVNLENKEVYQKSQNQNKKQMFKICSDSVSLSSIDDEEIPVTKGSSKLVNSKPQPVKSNNQQSNVNISQRQNYSNIKCQQDHDSNPPITRTKVIQSNIYNNLIEKNDTNKAPQVAQKIRNIPSNSPNLVVGSSKISKIVKPRAKSNK